MKALLWAAIAYSLAEEFDRCPDSNSDEVEEFYGKEIPKEVFNNYGGKKHYEIAASLVQLVFKEELKGTI